MLLRCEGGNGEIPWRLLGIHSAGLDMSGRDAAQDESLGLNCTWYADILMTLTKPSASASSAEGKIMSDTSKRDEWDQHNRDEAKERAAQQQAAGPTHVPVPTEPYANLSGSPGARDADLDRTGLFDEYERAMAAERTAWLAARDLVADERGIGAWNAWRNAVERTQQAARSVVNYQAGRSDRS